jgi:hypothetical protein
MQEQELPNNEMLLSAYRSTVSANAVDIIMVSKILYCDPLWA